MSDFKFVVVIGLAGGGTSAVAGVVHNLGIEAPYPHALMDKRSTFENTEYQSLMNDASEWCECNRMFKPDEFKDQLRASLNKILLDVQDKTVLLKHPNASFFLDELDEVLQELGQVQYISVERPVEDHIATLERRGWRDAYGDNDRTLIEDIQQKNRDWASKHDGLLVDYGQLMSDTESTVSSIARFLGVQVTEEAVNVVQPLDLEIVKSDWEDDSKHRTGQITNRLPENGTVLELGVFQGFFTRALAARRQDATIVGVDLWSTFDPNSSFARFSDGIADGNTDYFNKLYRAAKYNVATYGRRVRLVKTLTTDVEKVQRESGISNFDVVYIDADHSYNGCLSDIKAWYKHINIGGWIGGHDYANHCPGVIQAVYDVFERNNIKVDFPSGLWCWYVQITQEVRDTLDELFSGKYNDPYEFKPQ